jgi:multiple sugar transport system substrate-binding protein
MSDERIRRALRASLGGQLSRRDVTRGLAGLGLGAPVLGIGLARPRGAFAYRQASAATCSTDEVELLYMTHAHDPATAVNEQLIAEFTAMYPNVKITYDHAPHENYEQKVLTAFAGGEGPDVFWAGDWMVPQFVENELVAPVDPAAFGVASQEEFVGLFEPGALDAFTVDGQVLTGGISEYNTFSLLYNPAHFQASGLEPLSATEPITWERLAEIAGQLTQMDGETRVRSGFEWVYNVPIWTVLLFEPMLHQLGGQLIDPESGEPNFASPELIRVMQYVQDLRQEQNANDPAFLVDLLEDFANERSSMIVAGPWALPAIAGINAAAQVAVAPLPKFAEGERVTTLYAWAWFVSAKTDETKRCWAWNFLSFLTSKAQLWWDNVGYIQPRTDLTANGQSLADYRTSTLPGLEVFLEDFPFGRFQFRSTRYFEISAAWTRAFQEILEGGDVQEVLENTGV